MALETILSQGMIQRLGWTLLHFVWQATAVAMLLAIVLVLLRKASAGVRYIMACAALGLIVLLPVVTMQLIPVSTPQPIARIETPPAPVTVTVQPVIKETPVTRILEAQEPVRPETIDTPPMAPWTQQVTAKLEASLPYLVIGWLLGVFGLSLWHLGGWAQLHRLKRHMVKPVDASLQAKLNELLERLSVNRAVHLVESALVQVPTVVGWLRPVILLPASALTGLTTEQLEALLAHELAHIRRYDYLLNILQTIVETLGFYHPAVWWVSHKIRLERENCCDDVAVSLSGDRVRYARALASMEEIRARRSGLAVAAAGGNLFSRIRRLVTKETADSNRAGWIPSVITILLIAIIAIPTSIALNANGQIKNQSIASNKVILKLVDPNSRPVAGVRVGTSVDFSDTPKNPATWFLRDGGIRRTTRVTSDKYGKVTLEAGDLFWSVPPTEQKAPIAVLDKDDSLAALQELSREDLGKEVILTLLPGCRVHGRLTAAAARKRQLSADNLNVWVYWRVHTPCHYTSKQGQFEFLLPPGRYKLRFFSGNPNNSLTLPILIKPGQRSLDLTEYLDGTRNLPDTQTNGKVVLKLVDPNSQPVVGAWVGTFVDWSDVAESPPIWFLKDGSSYKASEVDRAAKVISNKEGKITLTEEELFKPFWPIEKTVPLTTIDAGHYLAGLRELSQNDLGTEVTLKLQPGCQVRGRVTAATARKRKWSTKVLTVLVYWRAHGTCQYSSREGRFEFVLPPGKYEVQVYADDPDKDIVLPIRIKPGQRELDLTGYLDGTSKPPAADTEPSAQFILDKMLEHRSRLKNLQYVVEDVIWQDPAATKALMEEQIKRMREKGTSERIIEHLKKTLSDVPETRYQILTCTVDDAGHSNIELTTGTYDASGKKVPREEKHVWAWNGTIETVFTQRDGAPGSAILKDAPNISVTLGHPWRSFTGTFCNFLQETIEADRSVSVDALKNGTYRVAFDYKTSRYVAIADPSKGYTCALQETYNEQGRLNSRTTATYEEAAEGIWFPISGQREEYTPEGAVRYRSTAKSTQIRINNPAFNASTFDVDIPQGAHVRDFTRNPDQPEVYRYGEPRRNYDEIVQSKSKFVGGFVVDENGSPVPGVRVEVCGQKKLNSEGKFSWTFSGGFEIYNAVTDSLGRFAIELQEDGFYNLRFQPENHAGIIAYDVPVGKADLKVSLPEGGTISGRVIRIENGRKVPIPSVEVKADQSDRGTYNHLGFNQDRKTVTDSEGRFHFDHLRTKMRSPETRHSEPWEYSPRAWTISYEKTSKTVVFYEDTQTEDIELVVEPDYTDPISLIGKRLSKTGQTNEDMMARILADPRASRFEMTWHGGGAGRREGMAVEPGCLRVHEIQMFDIAPPEVIDLAGSEARYGRIELSDFGKTQFTCGLKKSSDEVPDPDIFFIDVNHNDRLENNEILKGIPVSAPPLDKIHYGVIDIPLRDQNQSRLHRAFVWYGKYNDLYLVSHCYMRGRIRLGDKEVTAVLVDYNCDGRYCSGVTIDGHWETLGPAERDYDRIGWDADGDGKIQSSEQHFIGSYLVCDGGIFRVGCTTDGRTVAVVPVKVPMGRLHMPTKNAFVRLVGDAGPMNLRITDGAVDVPAGTYRVDYLYIEEPDDAGKVVHLSKSGRYFDMPWNIRAGVTTEISRDRCIITERDKRNYEAKMRELRGEGPQPIIASLLDEPLRNFSEFNIELDPQKLKNRRILICFWDMDQRPSRNLIGELAERAEELTRKNVTVFLVHTSDVEPTTLKQWLDESKIPFACGRVKSDAQETLFRWGVQAQPWLILTDDKGIVRAEGLSLEQLDEKIRKKSPNTSLEDDGLHEASRTKTLATDNASAASDERKGPMETVHFENVEAHTVIEKLAEWTGKTIIPPADLMKQKITIYSPQQIPRSEAAAMILNALCSKGYMVEQTDDTIYLKPLPEEQPRTEAKEPPAGQPMTRVFDISDLVLIEARISRGTVDVMMDGSDGMMGGHVNIPDQTLVNEAQNIASLIMQTIDPNSWHENNPNAKGTISPFPAARPRKLAIYQTLTAHQQIQKLLESRRERTDTTQISIGSRYLVTNAEFLDEVRDRMDIEFTSDTFLDDKQVETLLRASQKKRNIKSMTLPKVNVLNNETAQYKTVRQVFMSFLGYSKLNGLPQKSTPVPVDTFCSITPHIKDNMNIIIDFVQDIPGLQERIVDDRSEMVQPYTQTTAITNKRIPHNKTFVFACDIRKFDQDNQTASLAGKKTLIVLIRPTIIAQEEMPRSNTAAMTLNSLRLKDDIAEQTDDTIFIKPITDPQPGTGKATILIETRILTAGDAFMRQIGLDPNSVADSKNWTDYCIHASGDSASFVIDPLHADLILKAAMVHKGSKMIVEPRVCSKLCALNGKTIEINTPDHENYYALVPADEPNAPSGEPDSESNHIKLGTTIRLTPHLLPDGKTVELDFEWERRQLMGVKKHTGLDKQTQKIPTIAVDSIKTSCPVPDGKTLLIGGKRIAEQTEILSGMPVLRDLPLIGVLFSSSTKVREPRNLLILIKPVINPSRTKQAPRQTEPPPPLDPDDPLVKKLEEKLSEIDH